MAAAQWSVHAFSTPLTAPLAWQEALCVALLLVADTLELRLLLLLRPAAGAAAAAEGTVEQVLGLLPYNELQLAVTVSRHQPGRTGPSDAAEAQDMQLPYRRLEVSGWVQAATPVCRWTRCGLLTKPAAVCVHV